MVSSTNRFCLRAGFYQDRDVAISLDAGSIISFYH